MPEASLHRKDFAEAFRVGFCLKNAKIMQGFRFQYQDFVVQNKDGKDAGDIDAAFVLTQDTSLNEMLSDLCFFPPESLKAGTFIHFELTAKSGESITPQSQQKTICYIQKKVEFHKKLITGQYKFQLPEGVKQFFLVLLFNGVDCANAHTCFKSSMNDMKGISLYAGNTRVLQWPVMIKLEEKEKEIEEERKKRAEQEKEIEEERKIRAKEIEELKAKLAKAGVS